MNIAIKNAKIAQSENEIPVGAILVKNNQMIASAYNQPIQKHDPTAHAEIQVLQQAANNIGNYRLLDTSLYVTLEPCAMCAGAMIHARIGQIIFGAYDIKTGVAGSVTNLFTAQFSNHQPKIIGGILSEECSQLLKNFFKNKR